MHRSPTDGVDISIRAHLRSVPLLFPRRNGYPFTPRRAWCFRCPAIGRYAFFVALALTASHPRSPPFLSFSCSPPRPLPYASHHELSVSKQSWVFHQSSCLVLCCRCLDHSIPRCSKIHRHVVVAAFDAYDSGCLAVRDRHHRRSNPLLLYASSAAPSAAAAAAASDAATANWDEVVGGAGAADLYCCFIQRCAFSSCGCRNGTCLKFLYFSCICTILRYFSLQRQRATACQTSGSS